jgi:hypothetical protein
MRIKARAKGESAMLAVLVGGLLFVLAALIGFTVAFAQPLPAVAWGGFGVVVAIAVLLAAVAFVIVARTDRAAVEPEARRIAAEPGLRHILVVANETIGSEALRREVCERAAGCESEVLVVVPALNTPIRHWTDDEGGARSEAEVRLAAEMEILNGLGVRARGQVGADDPLQAVDDALRMYPADEIVIATHPEGRSNWLEEGVVGRLRQAYRLPVTHVIAR